VELQKYGEIDCQTSLNQYSCRIELAMSRLYQVLALAHKSTPTIAALWNKTAREEQQQAAQYRLAIGHAHAMLTGIYLDFEQVNQALLTIEALTERFRAHPPEIEDALRRTVELEDKLRHLHLDVSGQFRNSSHRRLFRAMTAADQEHIDSLKLALQSYSSK
jgi:hypothetical protein